MTGRAGCQRLEWPSSVSGEHGASDETLTGVLCLLVVGYNEEMESHLIGHRGRIAVFHDHRQEQDGEALRYPAGFPGWNLWASPPISPNRRTNRKRQSSWIREAWVG